MLACPQVFDVSNVTPNYRELQEVSLFLVQSGTLDPALALGLYISIGGAEWQYRGYVSNTQPSEVMPLQWPEQDQPSNAGPGVIQLGVSLEPLGQLVYGVDTDVAQMLQKDLSCALHYYPIISACCAVEVVQKEGTKLASRQEFAKRVALDLFRCVLPCSTVLCCMGYWCTAITRFAGPVQRSCAQ